MGRKKGVHPADAYRRKLREKERKKNKIGRQISRAASLRKLTEDEIINEIQKINAAENSGLADTKLLVRRKQLLIAYGEVQTKMKMREAREKTAKTVTVKGLNRLLGHEEKITKIKKASLLAQVGKENILQSKSEEEPEFPPGMPMDPAHERPPGIVERPQNTRRARTYLKRKESASTPAVIPSRRNFGEVEVIDSRRIDILEGNKQKHKRLTMEAQLLDPLNPASPFYLDRPGRRGVISQRDPLTPLVPTQPAAQAGPLIGPAPNPLAVTVDPSPRAMISTQPMYPQIHDQNVESHKLEVLLSDEMKAFVPTSLRVKRRDPRRKSKVRRKKTLDIAPDVGKPAAKVTETKNVEKKKAGMVTEKSYDAFLSEIENLV